MPVFYSHVKTVRVFVCVCAFGVHACAHAFWHEVMMIMPCHTEHHCYCIGM